MGKLSIPNVETERDVIDRIEDKLRGKAYDSIAFLYSDINHLRAWHSVYGDLEREAAILAIGKKAMQVTTEVNINCGRDRLTYIVRHKYDKFLSCDTGEVQELSSIAERLRDELNAAEIPGRDARERERKKAGKSLTVKIDGVAVELDSKHLTVRVGVVYQRNGPFDWQALLQETFKVAKRAKHEHGQILVVEYQP